MRFLLCCLILLLVGCNTHLSQSELYGEYEANARNGTLKLILNRDMSYEETANLKNGIVKQLAGQWKYDLGAGYLYFPQMFETKESEDFKNDDITGETIGTSIPATKFGLTICLEHDPNTDFCHLKVKSR